MRPKPAPSYGQGLQAAFVIPDRAHGRLDLFLPSSVLLSNCNKAFVHYA